MRSKHCTLAILTLSTIGWLNSAGCAGDRLQVDATDRICRESEGCIPVTQGFIEQRIHDLAKIAELQQALDACETRHTQSSWMLPTALTPDDVKCTVRGTVYAEDGKIDPPMRTDGCQMIRHEVHANGLTLSYRGRWVLIPFPLSGGHIQFAYRWGSATATIAGKEWAVARGGD